MDTADGFAFVNKRSAWYPDASPTVAQAFSDVGNPFGWQGPVHFAFDTETTDTDGTLMLVDHRLRIHDPAIGRWLNRDPAGYAGGINLYEYVGSNPRNNLDPLGLGPPLGRVTPLGCGLGGNGGSANGNAPPAASRRTSTTP